MQIIGHRGARGLWPENTLAGFQRAMNSGVKAFELDVNLTRDRVVVVTHDAQLNYEITQYRNGEWLMESDLRSIRLTNYEDIRQYGVGQIRPNSNYAKTFPNQQEIVGQKIPTLSDVLTLVCDRAAVTIEVKSFDDDLEVIVAPQIFVDCLQQVIESVTTPWDDITISSFDWRVLEAVHEIMPGIPTAALTEKHNEQYIDVVAQVKNIGATTWSPEYTDLNQHLVDRAHSIGLKVVTWTVNDPKSIELLEKMGVDGVITDYPCKVSSLTL